MTTYIVNGFSRSNHSRRFHILIDVDAGDAARRGACAVASDIVNDADICFSNAMNIDEDVPDDAKNIIFNSEAELYAKAPQLDPEWQKQQRRAMKREQRARERAAAKAG